MFVRLVVTLDCGFTSSYVGIYLSTLCGIAMELTDDNLLITLKSYIFIERLEEIGRYLPNIGTVYLPSHVI